MAGTTDVDLACQRMFDELGAYLREVTAAFEKMGAGFESLNQAAESAGRTLQAFAEADIATLTVPGRIAYRIARWCGFYHSEVIAWLYDDCPGAVQH